MAKKLLPKVVPIPDNDQWPADHVIRKHISALVPYARNARTHTSEQVDQIAASIRAFGWTMPVLVDEAGTIIAGHGRVLAAHRLGLLDVPTMVATGWSDAKRRAYALADNKLAMNADWDPALLKGELQELLVEGFDLPVMGFSNSELEALLRAKTEGKTDPDDVPEPTAETVTVPGDVWLLGRHRLGCGSSSDEAAHDFFGKVDLVCTDPPYCSGGFQESGKREGSVGTKREHKHVANDRLSTRGYQSLIRTAVFGLDADFFYVFTDWRMWTYLFDLAESSGASVRSMIVWNKGSVGIGVGWRSQHELILWGCRKAPPYDRKFHGVGNVISVNRQRNDLHTTQKPVETLATLLKGVPFVRTVADPFCGSGSTIVACEMDGRDCVAMEIDPAYVDVAVRRWQAFTGHDATQDRTGRTFTEVASSRRTGGAP